MLTLELLEAKAMTMALGSPITFSSLIAFTLLCKLTKEDKKRRINETKMGKEGKDE